MCAVLLSCVVFVPFCLEQRKANFFKPRYNLEQVIVIKHKPTFCLTWLDDTGIRFSRVIYGTLTHWGRENGCHFPDDIFKCIFLNWNVWISIKSSLKLVPRGLINNIPALVQIMAWRRPGDKPSSGPVMVRLLTHICVTRPQWVKWYLCYCSYLKWRSQHSQQMHHQRWSTGVCLLGLS